MKIVIISSDTDFARKLKEYLEFGGEFEVFHALYEEVKDYEKIPVSLFILEISRKNFEEGTLTLEFLKASKNLANVPVVVVSNYLDPDFLYRILKEGADDFIEKTSDFNLIKEKIKKLLK